MQGLIPAPLMQRRSCICGHTVKLTVALYSYACSTFLYSRYGLISSSIETLTQESGPSMASGKQTSYARAFHQ